MEYTIYSITCKDVEVTGVYVGSTNDLVNIKRNHKCNSRKEIKAHLKLYKVINSNGGISNWEFKILEIFNCETQHEAFIKEQYYIDKLQSDLNTYMPYTTIEEKKLYIAEYDKKKYVEHKDAIKQKYVKNKDKILENIKQCQSDNKEKIASQKSEKSYCHPCGLYHTRGNKAYHYKSKKHLDNLAKITAV
jgi:hypothetical protein